jgi:hypothetical protein
MKIFSQFLMMIVRMGWGGVRVTLLAHDYDPPWSILHIVVICPRAAPPRHRGSAHSSFLQRICDHPVCLLVAQHLSFSSPLACIFLGMVARDLLLYGLGTCPPQRWRGDIIPRVQPAGDELAADALVRSSSAGSCRA